MGYLAQFKRFMSRKRARSSEMKGPVLSGLKLMARYFLATGTADRLFGDPLDAEAVRIACKWIRQFADSQMMKDLKRARGRHSREA